MQIDQENYKRNRVVTELCQEIGHFLVELKQGETRRLQCQVHLHNFNALTC